MKNQDSLPNKSQRVKKTKVDNSFFNETLKPILSELGLLSILLAAIAYFLGWRFLYFYYASFGLDSMFLSFSPIDVFSAGWRIYILVAVMIVFAIFLMWGIQNLIQRSQHKRKLSVALTFFFIFFAASFVLAVLVVSLFFNSLAQASLGFYVAAYVCLLSLWLCYALGGQISSMSESTESPSRTFSLFSIIFPTPSFWLVVIFIGFVITTAFFSSYLGLQYRIRDGEEYSSRLPIATFYTNQQLDIPNGKMIRDNVWAYDDLRFLYKTGDLNFAFRPNEIEREGIYVIPQKFVLTLKLHGWYYRYLNPLDAGEEDSQQ